MPDTLPDSQHIVQYLIEVADRLGLDGPEQTVIKAGGSLLALRDLRQTTLDVDSVRRLDAELVTVVAAVAAEHGLAPRLVERQRSVVKARPAWDANGHVELRMGRLLVFSAPLHQVFLM